MTVSIIIPVLDDNEELSGLLTAIRAWKNQPHEIIVVDAKADPLCKSLCAEANARWLPYNKTRGAQQLFGAQHAGADALWFVYADCRPPQNALAAIRQTLQTAHGGYFKFSFALGKKNLHHRIIEFFINWRSRHFMVYGDQGLFFCKQTYFVLDGHADQSLFEEVKLVNKARKLGFQVIDHAIQASPRKWQSDGFWKRTFINRYYALRYLLGASAKKLNHNYFS